MLATCKVGTWTGGWEARRDVSGDTKELERKQISIRIKGRGKSKSYSQARSQRTDSLQRPRRQPRNPHHPHRARRLPNHTEQDSAVRCIACTQHAQLSIPQNQPLVAFQVPNLILVPSPRQNPKTYLTHLLVELLAIDISQRTLANKLSISMHFIAPVRRRHNRIIRAAVCKRRQSQQTKLS
jgi:hypothetical protein